MFDEENEKIALFSKAVNTLTPQEQNMMSDNFYYIYYRRTPHSSDSTGLNICKAIVSEFSTN